MIWNENMCHTTPYFHIVKSRPSFRPNLKGVFFTFFVGTLLKIWIAISNASHQKEAGELASASIDLTISNTVIFFLSATPFYYGVYDILRSCLISLSSQKDEKDSDIYSPPQSECNDFILVLVVVSTSNLKS